MSRCEKQLLVLPALVFFSFLFSCNQHHTKPGPSGFADESFADRLSSLLPSPDTSSVFRRSLENDVRLVYALDDYQPIWIKENYASSDAAEKLIEELEDMQWDGEDTAKYHLGAIRKLKTRLDTTKHNSLNDAIAFDTALTRCYIAAARFLLFGSVSSRRADSLWHHANDSVWSAPQMLVNPETEQPSLADFRSLWPTYELLRREYKRFYTLQSDSSYLNAKFNVGESGQADSIMRMSANYIIQSELPWLQIEPNDTISDQAQLIMAYQSYRSLRVTRKFDSSTRAELAICPDIYMKRLRANMERIRWMKRSPGNLYIVVDVPLMEMYFRRNSINVMHKRVVVGKTIRQTPSLNADMTNIVINPPWGVPPTILKKDVLPGIQKSGNAYLAKKGLRIFDSEGKAVKVGAITARNYRRYSYRQAPGDDNSLGYVKFNMPNKWDIYMHDTPHRDDFGKRDRAQSSGCVRVHEPQEMALYILSELEDKKNYTQGKLDTMISGHKTRWEKLQNKIPVFITYLTAFEDSTSEHVLFTRDIYQRDAKLMALMN